MKLKLSIIALAILFTSCINEPKQTEQNGNFKIEFLFEKDGCKMYRFRDGARYIYWTDKVICIDDYGLGLTLGKQYIVIRTNSYDYKYISIIDDYECEGDYKEDMFISLRELRDDKLDDILDG